MTLPKTLAAMTCISIALASVPALAATSDVHIKTKEISILGYDLSNRADAEAVLKKIVSTAESVCRLHGNRETLIERRLRQRCADKAIDVAVASTRSETLAALRADMNNK